MTLNSNEMFACAIQTIPRKTIKDREKKTTEALQLFSMNSFFITSSHIRTQS